MAAIYEVNQRIRLKNTQRRSAMPEIQLLDQATINQIAAGEVIDRPSSVVKELLENAIDAKATAITVEIKDGGISFIRITDNGCGIEKDQVRKAFLRHATSKLHTIDDLLDIGSLGFRGEALSSIAAIAQVELISKPPEAMLGISYQIEDGEEMTYTLITSAAENGGTEHLMTVELPLKGPRSSQETCFLILRPERSF